MSMSNYQTYMFAIITYELAIYLTVILHLPSYNWKDIWNIAILWNRKLRAYKEQKEDHHYSVKPTHIKLDT